MLLTALRLASASPLGKEVFVRSLPWTVGKKDLKEYFEKFGEVVSTSVAYDRNTALSLGYGFVAFKNPDSAAKALEERKHMIEGYKIEVSPSEREQSATKQPVGGLAPPPGPSMGYRPLEMPSPVGPPRPAAPGAPLAQYPQSQWPRQGMPPPGYGYPGTVMPTRPPFNQPPPQPRPFGQPMPPPSSYPRPPLAPAQGFSAGGYPPPQGFNSGYPPPQQQYGGSMPLPRPPQQFAANQPPFIRGPATPMQPPPPVQPPSMDPVSSMQHPSQNAEANTESEAPQRSPDVENPTVAN